MTTISVAELQITELQNRVKELEQTLQRHRICPVFNILTRPALEEEWEHVRHTPNLAIGFLDIDDLKLKNNELGQYETSKRIAEAFALARKDEIFGRFYSGDEAAIVATADEIVAPCERILNALKERGLSATIVIVPYKGEELLSDATKEANDLNQAMKSVRKGKIYNFLSQTV
jgi:GGDEF domain-containing protein